MKKFIIFAVVVILVAFAVYAYATRDLAAPSSLTDKPVDEASEKTATVYRIDGARSQARYELDEMLRGEPKHVVGVSSNISGQIEIVSGVVSIGDIAINARTFKTDAEKRDNAVGRYILKSEEAVNEFIVFKNVVVSNASGLAVAGKPFAADATGDLTIAGVTKSTIFRIDGAVGVDGLLTGVAQATVRRSDFSLKIPELSFIANVSDEVVLKVDIVAPAL